MPRPTRTQGRPGTRVIPENWGRSHAPVVEKAANGTCTISASTGGTKATTNADLSITPGTAPAVRYDNRPVRLQMTSAQEAHDIVGDQDEVTTVYLAELTYDIDTVELGDVLVMNTCDDPSLLTGRAMPVVKVGKGTERFARYVWVADRLNPTT